MLNCMVMSLCNVICDGFFVMSNLCADISVEIIASFNKMKSLTSNLSMVVQVMKRSELVEVQNVHDMMCIYGYCVCAMYMYIHIYLVKLI